MTLKLKIGTIDVLEWLLKLSSMFWEGFFLSLLGWLTKVNLYLPPQKIWLCNLNKINTEDYDYILSQALHTVAREDAPGDYQNILAPNGVPMYEDINYNLSVMMEILMEVLKFNFNDFFKDLPSSIPERS